MEVEKISHLVSIRLLLSKISGYNKQRCECSNVSCSTSSTRLLVLYSRITALS